MYQALPVLWFPFLILKNLGIRLPQTMKIRAFQIFSSQGGDLRKIGPQNVLMKLTCKSVQVLGLN